LVRDNYQHLPLTGTPADALVKDANNVIDAVNHAANDSLNGRDGQSGPDFQNLVSALQPTKADYISAIGSFDPLTNPGGSQLPSDPDRYVGTARNFS
jgi:hypothetical protein